MKITYNTTVFFNDSNFRESLKSFLQQYDGRFPGVEYLHLELEEATEGRVKKGLSEQFHYSSNGTMLKIKVMAQADSAKTTAYEVLTALRNVFDAGVEEHLKNHQHVLRYAPEL